MHGCDLGMPLDFPSFASTVQPTYEICDVQIWMNKYIDPAADIGKFFAPLQDGDDSTKFSGRRVKTSVPADTFGQPTYLFKGGANTFIQNAGTGGDFTEFLATADDYIKTFSPAPPLAT